VEKVEPFLWVDIHRGGKFYWWWRGRIHREFCLL